MGALGKLRFAGSITAASMLCALGALTPSAFAHHVGTLSCTFDPVSGELRASLSGAANQALEFHLEVRNDTVYSCGTLSGVSYASVRRITVDATGGSRTDVSLNLATLTRSDGSLPVVAVGSAPGRSSNDVYVNLAASGDAAPTVQALEAGVDVSGDGIADVELAAPDWAVQIRTDAKGGRYDLRRAPAVPNSLLEYRLSTGNDVLLTPASGPDVRVDMRGGNDRIDTTGGHDFIYSSALASSANIIHSGAGRDTIFAGPGNDQIWSGEGADVVLSDSYSPGVTGSGIDKVWLGDGNDFAALGPANDTAFGQGGNDRIETGKGLDRAYGGAGNDHLSSEFGRSWLYGQAGNDLLSGFGSPLTVTSCGPGMDMQEQGDPSDLGFGRPLASGCEREYRRSMRDPAPRLACIPHWNTSFKACVIQGSADR